MVSLPFKNEAREVPGYKGLAIAEVTRLTLPCREGKYQDLDFLMLYLCGGS